MGAISLISAINIIDAIAVALVASAAFQQLALRTKIALPGIIKDKVSSRRENAFLMRGSCSGMDAVFKSLLSGETFIPFAKLQIGNIGIQILILA